MFGGDESYDREGDGPAGGAPRDPAAAQEPAAHEPADPEAAQEHADPVKPEVPAVAQPPLPPPEPTGDERVDAVLTRFAELEGAPVTDHVEVFEDVQQRLQHVLASIDHEDDIDHGNDHGNEDTPGAPPGPPGGQP